MISRPDDPAERHRRQYIADDEASGGESDLKPLPSPGIPRRVWLSRPIDQVADAGGDPDLWQGHFEGGNEDWHFDAEGTFDELVRRAEAVGVDEYRVWSRAQNTFVVVDERPVRPVP